MFDLTNGSIHTTKTLHKTDTRLINFILRVELVIALADMSMTIPTMMRLDHKIASAIQAQRREITL